MRASQSIARNVLKNSGCECAQLLARHARPQIHSPSLSKPLKHFHFAANGSRPVAQSFISRVARFRIFNIKRPKHFSSRPNPDPTPHLGSPEPSLSLSQRLKKLSREYGWSAFGVYMALSALDFPFCFLAVRLLGTERIGRWEEIVVGTLKDTVLKPFQKGEGVEKEVAATIDAEATKAEGWGVEAAQEAHDSGATIWTQLALAYAIHKSFIFIRVPLTAAVTPKVVKVLRGWGWNIGKRTPKGVPKVQPAERKA